MRQVRGENQPGGEEMSIKVTVEFTDEEWKRRQDEAMDALWETFDEGDYPPPSLDGISPPNILRLAVGEPPRKHGGKREKLTYRSVS